MPTITEHTGTFQRVSVAGLERENKNNMFVILAKEGSNVIGTSRAQKLEESPGKFDPLNWLAVADFVEKEFRGRGLGKKLFAKRIEEIKRRGGQKILLVSGQIMT